MSSQPPAPMRVQPLLRQSEPPTGMKLDATSTVSWGWLQARNVTPLPPRAWAGEDIDTAARPARPSAIARLNFLDFENIGNPLELPRPGPAPRADDKKFRTSTNAT